MEDARIAMNNSSEREQLEKIRKFSNVIQALENLLVQLEEVEELTDFKNAVRITLAATQTMLTLEIHR